MNKEIEQKLIKKFPFEIKKKLIITQVDDFPAPAGTAMTKDHQHILLVYNEKLCQEMVDQGVPIEAIGVHELYHYLFSHLYIRPVKEIQDLIDKAIKDEKSLSEKEHEFLEKYQEKLLISCDCEVNSYLPSLHRPPMAYPQAFNLPLYQSWDWYFDNIVIPPQPKGKKSAPCSMSLTPEQKESLKGAIKSVAKSLGYDLEENPTPVKLQKTQAPARVKRGVRAAIERILGKELENCFEKARTFAKPHKYKEDGYPGRKLIEGPKLIFAIDCSGSTSGEQQKSYYEITRRLLKEYNATVIEFDNDIKHIGRQPSFTQWGGGTSFEPVQEKAMELKADAVIWFTDAQGSWDKDLALGMKHIVILSDESGKSYAEKMGRIVENYLT